MAKATKRMAASPRGIAAPPVRPSGVSTATKAGMALSAAFIPLAFVSMHRLAAANGFIPLLRHLRENGPPYLPGSTPEVYTRDSSNPEHPSYPKYGDSILRVFTGNEKVDYVLGVMNCFFAPMFRDAELTALGISFTGLFGVALALVWIEGERRWAGWRKAFSYPMGWGLGFQALGFGCVMPIYTTLYLLATATQAAVASSLPSSSAARLKALPISLVLGFLVPSLYMWGSHQYASTETHQILVAIWQIFPVYISFFQIINSRLISTSKNPKDQVKDVQTSLETLYGFLITFSRIFHMGTIAYVLSSFYQLSEGSTRKPIDVSRFLVPANPFIVAPIKSFADGTLAFLQWDYIFGTLSIAILFFVLRRKTIIVVESRGRGIVGGNGLIDRLITLTLEGPGAVIVKIAWEREAGVWDLSREVAGKGA